jgi:hypothetical protein
VDGSINGDMPQPRAILYGLHFNPDGEKPELSLAKFGPSSGFVSSSGGRVATGQRSPVAGTFYSSCFCPSGDSSSLQRNLSLQSPAEGEVREHCGRNRVLLSKTL